MQNADVPFGNSGSVFFRANTLASGLNTDEPDLFFTDKIVEQAYGITTAANAGDTAIGQTAFEFQNLAPYLATHNGLKIADNHRIGMRAHDRPNQVVCFAHSGHPIAQRFVDRVLECGSTGIDLCDRGAKKPHSENIEGL